MPVVRNCEMGAVSASLISNLFVLVYFRKACDFHCLFVQKETRRQQRKLVIDDVVT